MKWVRRKFRAEETSCALRSPYGKFQAQNISIDVIASFVAKRNCSILVQYLIWSEHSEHLLQPKMSVSRNERWSIYHGVSRQANQCLLSAAPYILKYRMYHRKTPCSCLGRGLCSQTPGPVTAFTSIVAQACKMCRRLNRCRCVHKSRTSSDFNCRCLNLSFAAMDDRLMKLRLIQAHTSQFLTCERCSQRLLCPHSPFSALTSLRVFT